MRYVFGDCTLDTERYELHRAGVCVPLRPKVFQLLAYLITHRDRVVLKDELVAHLWPEQFVGDAALKSCIMTARKAVGDAGRSQRIIQTLHGHGYRLVAAVTMEDRPAPASAARPVPSNASAPPAPIVETMPGPATGASHPPTHTLEQEHKQVTVLWCTLAQATTLAAQFGPEAMHALMHEVLAVAQRTMQRYEGTITQYMGDGFLALFGAPVAHEDHARRAVLAALELRQQLRACGAGLALPQDTSLAVCIGLHTGPVVVGYLDSDPQRLYTAVGETTHLVTRLQPLAAPGTVVMSATTYRLVRDEVWAEACGSLDGAEAFAPVAVYTVQGIIRYRAGVPGQQARGLSRFMGRTQELTILHERLTYATQGQGQVVGLVGEPGMGKSRLLYEFAQSLTGQAVTYCEGHCLVYGSATPYLLMRNLLQQLCGLGDVDAPERIVASVDRYVQQVGMAPAEDTSVLLRLLDVRVDATPLQLSPDAYKTRAFALLQQVLLAESRRQPLILTVENLHWIDATSEEWLTTLVERLAGTAILLLATYRPGYRPAWLDKSYATQLALPRLTPEESVMVVQAVAQTTLLPDHLRQGIIAKAAGNPFFLEELTRSVQEEGHHTALTIPDTIQAVLAARIDRLPAVEKRLLQTIAVIGKDVPLPLLHAIADLPEETLRQSLIHLQASEFLYETQLFPESEYTFKHALTHEVTYGSLLHERRRVLHARIVEILEDLARERLTEQVERLAHHALHGEVWDKALAYCRQAGEKAVSRSAYREAVGYFEQALSALPHLPEQRDTREQAIDLRLALRWALYPSGDLGRILAYLREAEALAEALDDPRRLGQVSSLLSVHFYIRGAYDQAIAAAQRALVLAAASGEVVLHALANQNLGRAYQAQGDYRRAIDCYGQTVASLDGARRYERFGLVFLPAVLSRARLAVCHAELGTFAEGRALGDEGLRMAEAVAHPASLMIAYFGIGLLALRQGDLPRALPRLERVMGICQDADLPIYFPQMAATLGAAYTLVGRVADAVPLLTQALEQNAALERVDLRALCSLPLGEAQALAGRLEEAQTLAECALALARVHQERGHEAYALRLLGEIAVRRKPPEWESAEAHYHQALALADELGMRPLVAHCHLGLGTLYVKIGCPELARAELSAAVDLYRAMDMTFWLPQAEMALAQVEAR